MKQRSAVFECFFRLKSLKNNILRFFWVQKKSGTQLNEFPIYT